MAISKVILNGETLMDVTSDTVEAGKLLSGETATKNDGTKVTGNYAVKLQSLVTQSPTWDETLVYTGNVTRAVLELGSNNIQSGVSFNINFDKGGLELGKTYHLTGVLGIFRDCEEYWEGDSSEFEQSIILDTYWVAAATEVPIPFILQPMYPDHYNDTLEITSVKISMTSMTITGSYSDLYVWCPDGGIMFIEEGDGYSSVTVNPVLLQTLSGSVAPTESVQHFYPDTGYMGFNYFSVDAISDTYVGTRIARLTSSDLSVTSSGIMNIPSGYINNQQGLSSAIPRISTLTPYMYNSATGTVIVSATPSTGYVHFGDLSSDTKREILYLPKIGAQTIIPGSTSQYISSYQWLTGSQTIAAIPSSYLIPSGTYSISSNGTYDIGSYQSVDVSCTGEDSLRSFLQRNYSGITSIMLSNYAEYSLLTSQLVYLRKGAFIGLDWSRAGTTLTAEKLECIGSYAFMQVGGLSMISLPQCRSIMSAAFYQCSSLTSIYIPNCTYIGYSAFNGTLLSSVDLPACKTIQEAAFKFVSLTSINIPLVTSIGTQVFYETKITEANAQECQYIGMSAFAYCTQLSSVYLPNCTSMGKFVFAGCIALSTICMPKAISITGACFIDCNALSLAVFSACTLIQSSAFLRCYNLLSLYLLGSSVTSLSAANAFTSTPISNYTTSTGGVYGSIFVPASLYESYISATNWSYYSDRIVSLTDEEIEALEF